MQYTKINGALSTTSARQQAQKRECSKILSDTVQRQLDVQQEASGITRQNIAGPSAGPSSNVGAFTWKEDDPSARIILEGSFGLHAETRLLGSTFHLVYTHDHPSTFVFGALKSHTVLHSLM